MSSYTGWPKKNATFTINNFKKTRDRMKKLCALSRIKFFSQQDDTKNANFDEGVLILLPLSDAMSFSRFALLSQKSQFMYWRLSIVWLPRVKCMLLLCKAKPAWIKRSIHCVILQHYNPGELLKRNSSLPQTWLLIQKEQILKMTLPQINCSRIKMPSSKSLILVSFCWKKNVLFINALTNLI